MKKEPFKPIRQLYGELAQQCDKHARLIEQLLQLDIWGIERCLAYARLENGCLHLLAKNTAAATRLRASSDQIGLALRQLGYSIERIKISNAPPDTQPPPGLRPTPDRRPKLSAEAHRAILSLSNECGEPHLAKALKQLASRYTGDQDKPS